MAAKKTVQRVNVDFPIDMLKQIDAVADRRGVTRQAFIKNVLADVIAHIERLNMERLADAIGKVGKS